MAEDVRKIKLLILTQKVDINDPILGFFHGWIEEFARHCGQLTVICLQEGEHRLPHNVKILSLGKESGVSRPKYLLNFYRYIWRERKAYDSVFVHMNPVYVILGCLPWGIFNKNIFLWYSHSRIDLKFRIGAFFAKRIFTVSRASFKENFKKMVEVGHGIDIESFRCEGEKKGESGIIRILHVGRVTEIKNCDTLIEMVALLKRRINKPITLRFVGGPITKKDDAYLTGLQKLVTDLKLEKEIEFMGMVPNYEAKKHYCWADISVNLSSTGGVDKAVLESMAAGVTPFASNKVFEQYFGEYGKNLVFGLRQQEDLALKVINFLEMNEQDRRKMSDYLLGVTKKNFDYRELIKKILAYF